MNINTLAPQVITALACAVIFYKSEPVLNKMRKDCRVMLRMAFILLTAGSAGIVLMITQGYIPPPWVALLVAGVAFLLLSERRAIIERPRT